MAKRYDYSEFAELQQVSKLDVANFLSSLNGNHQKCARVRQMASEFRARFVNANATAPSIDGKSTNPFVLSAFALKNGISSIGGLDDLLVAAKIFSSLETAMGRVVEDIVPQQYGWETVSTPSHTPLSEIDCAKQVGGKIYLAALKSGPACVNDSMVAQIGNAIASNYKAWGDNWECTDIEFVVGMNYSTAKNSNKKDWHAVRLAQTKLLEDGAEIVTSCLLPPAPGKKMERARPKFYVRSHGYQLTVSALQGIKFWQYIGNPEQDVVLEICAALSLAASDALSKTAADERLFKTGNFASLIDIPEAYISNASEYTSEAFFQWMYLFVRHFVDDLAA